MTTRKTTMTMVMVVVMVILTTTMCWGFDVLERSMYELPTEIGAEYEEFRFIVVADEDENIETLLYISYSLDGNDPVTINCEPPYKARIYFALEDDLFMDEGYHTLYFEFYDATMNSIGSYTWDIYCDRTPPANADAGPDQYVYSGETVYLNGLNSHDNGNPISYYWSFEYYDKYDPEFSIPFPVTARAAQTYFVAPECLSEVTATLNIYDDVRNITTDECIIYILHENIPPVADAGYDQTTFEGNIVILDATDSYDDDNSIVSYKWTQESGPSVTIIDSESPQASFETPEVGHDGDILTFKVTVTDDHMDSLSNSDTCIITILGSNDPPIVDAGDDKIIIEGETVYLDGNDSYDIDGSIHSYTWSQSYGTPITLSDSSAVTPTFVAPSVTSTETIGLVLSVLDDGGLYNTDLIVITINDNGIEDFEDDVTSTETPTNRSIGFKAQSGGAVTYFNCVMSNEINDTNGMPLEFPYGLIDIELKVDVSGGTVVVTMYLDTPVSEDYKWFKYNNEWIDYSNYTEFNESRDEVTLTFVDGGIGDDDGIANGIIIDPSGIGLSGEGVVEDSTVSTGGSSSGGGCFISTLW